MMERRVREQGLISPKLFLPRKKVDGAQQKFTVQFHQQLKLHNGIKYEKMCI